jgi:TetR/AcrR family transcriptional repressor of nem operon
MGRASRADAAKHRGQVVTAAARMFRERGLAGVSVPELMAEAGLTHGGFYRHFESKESLAGTACLAAFGEQFDRVESIITEHPEDRAAAHAELLDRYLSTAHRDDPGGGCANAGLACDAARSEPGGPVRASFATGLERAIDQLARLVDQPAGSAEARRAAVVEVSTLVGALMLARAASDNPISEQILNTVRTHLNGV